MLRRPFRQSLKGEEAERGSSERRLYIYSHKMKLAETAGREKKS